MKKLTIIKGTDSCKDTVTPDLPKYVTCQDDVIDAQVKSEDFQEKSEEIVRTHKHKQTCGHTYMHARAHTKKTRTQYTVIREVQLYVI